MPSGGQRRQILAAIVSIVLAAGIGLGVIGGWLLGRARATSAAERAKVLSSELDRSNADLAVRLGEISALHREVGALQGQVRESQQGVESQRAAFEMLAADALTKSNESFLTLATQHLETFQARASSDLDQRQRTIEEVVRPVRETLEKVDAQIARTEEARREAHGELSSQVRSLADSNKGLQSETQNLVTALRAPQARGRWGEVQLRRVVEMAGMVEYCDFETQQTTESDEGRLRPDMIVNLPGGKTVVVDAKTPLDAYLSAVEEKDLDIKKSHLERHAAQVRDHIKKLGAKSYWSQFDSTPELVVMFLPGEAFFSAALDENPSLIQEGVDEKVILASPTTLIALLRAISYGWQQERLARDSQTIANLGKELSDRIGTMVGHVADIGKRLGGAVDAYNKAVGSMESRVLVSARKFSDTVSAPAEISELEGVDKVVREIRFPENRDTPQLIAVEEAE